MPLPETPTRTRGQTRIFSALQPMAGAVQDTVEKLTERLSSEGWTPQPIEPTLMRFSADWEAPAGTGEAMACLLSSWPHIRFEIAEEIHGSQEAYVWRYTPSLGIFQARLDEHGKVLVSQESILGAFTEGRADAEQLMDALSHASGNPWEEELRCFRLAEQQPESNIRWLSHP